MPGGNAPIVPQSTEAPQGQQVFYDNNAWDKFLNAWGTVNPLIKWGVDQGRNLWEHGVDLGPLGHVGDSTNRAQQQIDQSGMPSDIAGADAYEQAIRAGLAQGPRGNPYSVMAGNQSRDALEQALEHLHTGTSTIAGQTARAMGSLQQQGAAAVADSGGGLGAMRAAGGVAANASGIADQAGQGRLQEWMAQQGTYGQGLGALRGQDQSQQQAYTNAGLQAQSQDNGLQQFYANLGSNLQNARDAAAIERYKAYQRARLGQDQSNLQAAKMGIEGAGTVTKVMTGGGGP